MSAFSAQGVPKKERNLDVIFELKNRVFQSKLFDCKIPKLLFGKKLSKTCGRCKFQGTSNCPLQTKIGASAEIYNLDQFRKDRAASTAALASTKP